MAKSALLEKRHLPRGVREVGHKFQSHIYWCHKLRHIGVFNTSKEASDAYLVMRKCLERINVSDIGDCRLDTMFDAAKMSIRASYRGFVPVKRDLPQGVRKLPSGKFKSTMCRDGKDIYVGTFVSRDEAVAALEARKILHDAAAAKKTAPIIPATCSDAAEGCDTTLQAVQALVATCRSSTRPRKEIRPFQPGGDPKESNPAEDYGLLPPPPKKTKTLTGSRPGSPRRSTRLITPKDRYKDGVHIFSKAEMTLDKFLERKEIMRDVNKTFTRDYNEGVSKPALSQLNLAAEDVKQLQSIFFDDDGSLRDEMKLDVDSGMKNDPRYIDFANVECKKKRKDARWQVPSKFR